MVTLQIIVPVLVAVGGGLAFLAYQHPRDYRKLAVWLLYLNILLNIGGTIWSVSNGWTKLAAIALPSLTVAQLGPLEAAMDAVSLPWWWWSAGTAGAAYVIFLISLPAWISDVGNRYRTSELNSKKE
jgi:hypothetical protein